MRPRGILVSWYNRLKTLRVLGFLQLRNTISLMWLICPLGSPEGLREFGAWGVVKGIWMRRCSLQTLFIHNLSGRGLPHERVFYLLSSLYSTLMANGLPSVSRKNISGDILLQKMLKLALVMGKGLQGFSSASLSFSIWCFSTLCICVYIGKSQMQMSRVV